MEVSNDEISLKEIIEKIKEYATLLWSKKFWIVLIALIFALFFGVRAYFTPVKFVAKSSFMINDDDGGGMSGLSSLLGQFGMGGGGGTYNYSKIIKIAYSNKILNQVLFDSAEVNGEIDYIANHLIDIYELHEEWESDTALEGFYFEHPLPGGNRFEHQVLKSLIYQLRGHLEEPSEDRLLELEVDNESTILRLEVQSRSEGLSIKLAETWYDKISNFYISKSIERQKSTYDALEHKTDSIYGLLVSSERSAAQFQDQSRALFLSQSKLPYVRSLRNVEMYTMMYGEALRNKETAEFMLNNSTPFFQLIDEPFLPLKKVSTSVLTNTIIGAFIGGILSILCVVALKFKEDIGL